MTAAQLRKAGFRVNLEPFPEGGGYEFLVARADDDKTICVGMREGCKRDAYVEAARLLRALGVMP